MTATTLHCGRTDCTFGEADGACANGHSDPPHDCPDLVQLPNAEVASPPPASPRAGSFKWVSLEPAGALDQRRAYGITAAAETRIIVVCGLAGAGKTTLLTSIYDRLHAGPVGSFYSVFTVLNAAQRAAGIVSDHELNEWDAPLPI
jgi:hypothetical protein